MAGTNPQIPRTPKEPPSIEVANDNFRERYARRIKRGADLGPDFVPGLHGFLGTLVPAWSTIPYVA